MSAVTCDRCGRELHPVEASDPSLKTKEGRLVCGPCQVALAPAKKSPLPGVLAASLLVAGIAGWGAFRLAEFGRRLDALEKARAAASAPASPALAPEDADLLKRLREKPAASAGDVLALKEEMKLVREALKTRGPAFLAPAAPPAPASQVAPPAPEKVPAEPERTVPVPVATPIPELAAADPMIRYRALGKLEEPSAAQALPLLKDEVGFVRRGAAEALGRLKSAAAVPGLVAMARSESDVLARRAALAALEAITGVPCLAAGDAEVAAALDRCQAWASEHARKGGTP